MRAIRVLWCLCIVLGPCGCDARNGQVHYRIPDGARGVFIVSMDANRGLDVFNRDATIDVPLEGIVIVKELGFLRRFHVLSASYTSGKAINNPDNTACSKGDVCIWTLCSTSDKVYYFVGKFEERPLVADLRMRDLDKMLLSDWMKRLDK
jgi:hypothetical protein